MGVYIKGMKMPTNCGDCKAFVCYKQWAGDIGDCFCGITKNDAKAKEKNTDCPLIPVPPHGDLIGREWLIDIALHLMNTAKNDDIANGVKWMWQYIIDAPTIIPAELQKEE